MENEVATTTDNVPSHSSVDDSWSVVDITSSFWPMNFEILADPVAPCLDDEIGGYCLSHQLLRNNIVYPGKFDKSGTDTLILYDTTFLEKSYKRAFRYVMDAILGYFYDLIQNIVEKEYQKDIALYIFFDTLDENSMKAGAMETLSENLLDFISSYRNVHKLIIVLVVQDSVLLTNKYINNCIAYLKCSGVFANVDLKDSTTIKERLDVGVIPKEYMGELDESVMDIWTTQRLQFEVFWGECRKSYERLQYLPSELQRTSDKVLTENEDKSLEEVMAIYRYEVSALTFASQDKDLQVHGNHILGVLEDSGSSNRCDYKTMINAIHSLVRIMSDLENCYNRLRNVLEEKLESRWRWNQFKRDVFALHELADGVKKMIEGLKNNNVDNQHQYNECYATMQTVKTVFHELSKRLETLPERKQEKAKLDLQELEPVIADCFSELGKNNEKMISTEFVLNIQYDILSWVNKLDNDLDIQFHSGDDILRTLLDRDYKIRTELENCPFVVIEEYFTTCERIGTDFLLASVLAVESSISRLLVNATTVSHHIAELTKIKSNQILQKLQSLLKRLEDVGVYSNTPELMLTVGWVERLIEIAKKIYNLARPLELPEIQDISAFRSKYKESEINSKDLYDEFIMEIENFDAEGELPQSVFARARALSGKSKSYSSPNNGKESPRSSIRLSFSTKGRKSQESATDKGLWHPPVENLLAKVEEVVKTLEKKEISKKADMYGNEYRDTNNKNSRKVSRIIQEFEESEESYIRSLTYFKTEILDVVLKNNTSKIANNDREVLETASDLLRDILEVNTSFLEQLKSANKAPIKVAQVFTSKKNHFQCYLKFISIQPTLERVLTDDCFKNQQLRIKDPLPPVSYVTKPMQRLCKYKLLFDDMILNFHHVFTFPQLNQASLQSKKILRSINDNLHLRDEEFYEDEPSQFHLYSKVSLTENRQSSGERKAYLFQKALYLVKNSGDHVKYDVQQLIFNSCNKRKLEIELSINAAYQGPHSTLNRTSSIKRKKHLTLMFPDYAEMIEWIFKLNNIIGNY